MTFYRINPDTGELIECGSVIVQCQTPGCLNESIPIEVADDPTATVACGPCGQWIAQPTEPPELPGVSS